MLAIMLTHNVDQQRWHLGKTMWHQPQGGTPQAGNIGKQLKYYNLPANMIAGKQVNLLPDYAMLPFLGVQNQCLHIPLHRVCYPRYTLPPPFNFLSQFCPPWVNTISGQYSM